MDSPIDKADIETKNIGHDAPAVRVLTSETGLAHEPTPAYLAQPWYRKPVWQVVLMSFVCFMCPGMFNALNGLGGGGKQDATTADNGSVALYSTFSVFAFFGGTIANKIGMRATLAIGASGYGLYIGSLYSTVVQTSQARENFVIAAGALLGACAGLLWTAQGAIMLAYATERTKGRYVALFWSVFNCGAVIGAVIPMATNWNRPEAKAAAGSTYIAFMVLNLTGIPIACCLAKPSSVILPNGKPAEIPRQPTWLSELKGLFFTLRHEPIIFLLVPYFLSSNWFFAYQFNGLNSGGRFDIRGRSLNNLIYWVSQIVGAVVTGFFLDANFSRKFRAYAGWIWNLVLVMAVFGGNYAFQRGFTRETAAQPGYPVIQLHSGKYAGFAVLYAFNAIVDSAWQCYGYWLLGSLSNDTRKLAYLTGFYKGIQSAGVAITFRIDSNKTPFMTELIVTWALMAVSLLFMLPVVYLRVNEHTVEKVVDAAGDVEVAE